VSRESREQTIDLHLATRSPLLALGEEQQMLDQIQQAERLARHLGDQRRIGRAASHLASYYWQMGEYERARECAERALALAVAVSDLTVQVTASMHLGQIYLVTGAYPRSIDHLRQNLALLKGDLADQHFGLAALPAVMSRSWIVRSLAECGEFGPAALLAEEGSDRAATVNQPFGLVSAAVGKGYLEIRRGNIPTAIATLEGARAIVQSTPRLIGLVAMLLGLAYALGGRAVEAVDLVEQMPHTAARVGLLEVLFDVCLGTVYLQARRGSDATAVARRALALARERKERGHEAWALHLLGEIAAQAEPPHSVEAEGYYHQALTLAEELGMRPLVAHCHLGLGTLYGKIGRDEQSQAELTTAAEMYRAMEMAFWLERAETAQAHIAR
jgi:tetratricopeptide (TPR) repeat protein